MIPLPISVSDMITICKFLNTTISHCLSAAEDKFELTQVLTQLDGIVSLLATRMEQYILYADQLRVWYPCFEACKVNISKLLKTLMPNASGAGVFGRMRYAMLDRWGLEKEVKKLKEQVSSLRIIEETIVQEATKKSALGSLKFQEKLSHVEVGPLDDENVEENYCASTLSRHSQSGRINTGARVGKVSKLREKFST